MHDRNGNLLAKGDVVLVEAEVVDLSAGPDYCNVTVKTVDGRRPDGSRETVSAINTGVLTLFRKAPAVGVLLAALLAITASGCASASAGVMTDADHATVATELAFVSLNDAGSGVVWQPLDDRPTPAPDPSPAPRPFTGKAVDISNGSTNRVVVAPVEITYADDVCSDGSCSSGEFGDRPRRPLVRGAAGVARGVGFLGRVANRARPIRRIGGFLFRRCC